MRIIIILKNLQIKNFMLIFKGKLKTARTPLITRKSAPLFASDTSAAPVAIFGPGTAHPLTWTQWLKENPFAPLFFILTLVPYSFINAAFAESMEDASLAEIIALAVFTILASDTVNLAFDVLTAKEIQDDIGSHVAGMLETEPDRVRTAWQKWGPIAEFVAFYAISFHTAIAWKIAGEKAIDSFSDRLPEPITASAQVVNDIYMFFTALMFAMAMFKLPGLVRDIFSQKDPLIKILLGGFLLAGGTLGLLAYFALADELLSFPAGEAAERPDFLGKYLLMALGTWRGFAYVFPTTQSAFCVLNSTRGLIELMKHVIGLFESKREERFLRAEILLGCITAASLAIFTSAYQATGILRDGISACSLFVNLSALAKLIRLSYERVGRLEPFDAIVDRSTGSPLRQGAQRVLDTFASVFCCSRGREDPGHAYDAI